jgi:hypothetical protein
MSNSDAQWRQIVRVLSTDLLAVDEAQCIVLAGRFWHRIVDKFSPLIGAASVNVLLVRSIQLNIPLFPFLAGIALVPVSTHALSELEKAFVQQPRNEVMAANFAIMQQFFASLAGLIGDRLCGQLLHSTFPDHDADDAAQELN